ncbi:DDE superfamily endonuclease-domain-containing protein [Parasitella parasitica]|nr:DDE superfamily endonuclease-domain-containing protein [Parasitella parasitica]
MDQFIYEDGKGNLNNEEDEQVAVLEMEVDELEYSLEDVTNYLHMYLDLKPPEKPVKIEQVQEQADMENEEKTDNSPENKRIHRSYKLEAKNYFFYLIYEKGMSVRAAAQEIKVPQSTAQTWKKKAELAGDEEMEPRQSGSGRKAAILCMDVMDQHPEFKDYYLIMDNAPIHKHEDIQKYIEDRGYRCLYLPSYSSELNPIEQFWSVAKMTFKVSAATPSVSLMIA